MDSPPPQPPPQSPTRSGPLSRTATTRSLGNGNALSHLQPAQVRTLRDGFQILDRDCDGVVNGEDVADMLNQLGTWQRVYALGMKHTNRLLRAGLPNSPSDVAQFFPSSRQQTIALAAFLNSLAEVLAALSPSAELVSAFSAFDDDDSGQVDWAELREAVLRTAPEPGERVPTAAEVDKIMGGFTGRRAFNRNINAQLGAKRGEVFKYQDFVSSIMGSNVGTEGGSPGSSDDCER